MTELLDIVVGQIIGNISTVLIGVLLYYNFLLFEDYFRIIVWAFLLSQALRGAKVKVISILEDLSTDEKLKEEGLLYSIYKKSFDYMFSMTGRHRRSISIFLLDNGIFIFALVGGISVVLRMISWFNFINYMIIILLLLNGILWILGHKIFYYRYLISDKILVSFVLIVGMFVTVGFVMVFLSTESFIEGSQVASDVSDWVQARVINDERTKMLWTEQVSNGKTMVRSALEQMESDYNETMWWPPVKNVAKLFYDHQEFISSNLTTQGIQLIQKDIKENLTLSHAFYFIREKVNSFNLTSTQLSDWTATGIDLSRMMFGSVAHFVIFILSLAVAFVSLGIRAVFFVTSLFYLLCTDIDPVEKFAHDLIPVPPEAKPKVLRSLRRSIEGAFFLPIKLSSLHAIITLISFSLLDADFVYLATLLTFFFSAIPIVPPYLISLPWALTICFTTSFFRGFALFVIQYSAFTVIDDALYEKNLGGVNSYVSALSVVFGVYVFGWEGVVFGPLLVCGVWFAYDLSGQSIHATSSMEDNNNLGSSPLPSPTSKIFRAFSFRDWNETNNIFSNAYRVISGESLMDGVRRFSFDHSAKESESIMMTLIVKTKDIDEEEKETKYRFVAFKDWTYEMFIEEIEMSIPMISIQGVFTKDNEEIISVSHVQPGESLFLLTKPKTKEMIQAVPKEHQTDNVKNCNMSSTSSLSSPTQATLSYSSPQLIIYSPRLNHTNTSQTPNSELRKRKKTSPSNQEGDTAYITTLHEVRFKSNSIPSIEGTEKKHDVEENLVHGENSTLTPHLWDRFFKAHKK